MRCLDLCEPKLKRPAIHEGERAASQSLHPAPQKQAVSYCTVNVWPAPGVVIAVKRTALAAAS